MLELPIDDLKGVGKKNLSLFNSLSLKTVKDLLFHLPIRYEDRTRIIPISLAIPSETSLIEGEITSINLTNTNKPILNVTIDDGTGKISLQFFHYASSIRNKLSIGMKLLCFGQIRLNKMSYKTLSHPEYKVIEGDYSVSDLVSDRLTPVYSTTKGLGQKLLRSCISQALKLLNQELTGGIYNNVIAHIDEFAAVDIYTALINVHFPMPEYGSENILSRKDEFSQRLITEELLTHYLSLNRYKNESRKESTISLKIDNDLSKQIISGLPFTLTSAQSKVLDEIDNDLSSGYSMLRLVQGDVGSGKTIVAAIAASSAAEKKYQVALMAPTELLAQQHYKNFVNWFEPLGIKVSILSGRQKVKERRSLLENISLGITDIVIGTHALFQDSVSFKNLQLVIIDEQHRFGVDQRLSLKNKSLNSLHSVHQLIMTATPIPRSLAMTMYSQLEISIIDELPPGRQEIKTIALPQERREELTNKIREVCYESRQVYWVCTLIDESEKLQAQTAEETYIYLTKQLPDLRVGLVHGRLSNSEKEFCMQEFKNGQFDVLVATTVIEVGVDVPNATLMVIENAERLGLAQLHQLRGRVGRGSWQSFCILLYSSPLSSTAKQRIEVMRETNDGFKIADKDFNIRGPGEVMGTKQTGDIGFKIADLRRDSELLSKVKSIAENTDGIEILTDVLMEVWLDNASEYAKV